MARIDKILTTDDIMQYNIYVKILTKKNNIYERKCYYYYCKYLLSLLEGDSLGYIPIIS